MTHVCTGRAFKHRPRISLRESHDQTDPQCHRPHNRFPTECHCVSFVSIVYVPAPPGVFLPVHRYICNGTRRFRNSDHSESSSTLFPVIRSSISDCPVPKTFSKLDRRVMCCVCEGSHDSGYCMYRYRVCEVLVCLVCVPAPPGVFLPVSYESKENGG